jgi:protein phosphatase
VASALALETLVESLEDGRSLEEALALANERVHSEAKDPGKRGMGTTLVVMLLDGDRYRIANVGDSRGYLLSGDEIRQITRDHSFVAEAVEKGVSEEEAQASKWKDALTRSIGTDASVEADLFGPFSVEPDTVVLLCSDGLYKSLDDSDVLDIYRRSGSPDGAAQALVTTALERGSDDNITVAVSEFGELPREQAGGTMELEWEAPDDREEEPRGAGTSAGAVDEGNEAEAGEEPGARRSTGLLVAVVLIGAAAVIGALVALM